MIYDVSDIQNEVLVRGGLATSTAFVTDQILNDWTRQGYKFVANWKKWPYTEGRVSTTFTGAEEWSYPEGWRPDSIRILRVGDKRVRKLDFNNYQIFREEESSASERVYSDFGLTYFVNPNIDLSGTMVAFGQYTPTLDPTDKTAVTVFSGIAEEGNEAIVNEILSFLRTKERKPAESKYYHELAIAGLNKLWEEHLEEQYQYQTHLDSGGMFKRLDVLEGGYQDEIFKRDQF